MRNVVVIRVADQDFGVPVTQVRDVLRRRQLTPVPLAPRVVAGVLNLRGRIVTAIDLRSRLGLAAQPPGTDSTLIVVENAGELYALVVDDVGDVMPIEERRWETVPLELEPRWRAVASAVYTTDTGLLVLLDIARLLDVAPARRAAS